jgi:hypothetical protein
MLEFLIGLSMAFAEGPAKPQIIGDIKCVNRPKQFNIVDENSKFKNVTIDGGHTVRIQSDGSNEPLEIDCSYLTDKKPKSTVWSAFKEEKKPNIWTKLTNWATGTSQPITLTNRNEFPVESKVDVYREGKIVLSNKKWPDGISLVIQCAAESKGKSEGLFVNFEKKGKLVSGYSTSEVLTEDKKTKACPAENFDMSVADSAISIKKPGEATAAAESPGAQSTGAPVTGASATGKPTTGTPAEATAGAAK